METLDKSSLDTSKTAAAQTAKEACDYLLKTFSFVPDDKLNWSPSESARSALQQVAHCALANEFFAELIRNRPVELPVDLSGFRDFQRKMEAEFTDRQSAADRLASSTDVVVRAISDVDESLYSQSPSSPFGPQPMEFWMHLAGAHMRSHASQLDYLQTIWGDTQDHF